MYAYEGVGQGSYMRGLGENGECGHICISLDIEREDSTLS